MIEKTNVETPFIAEMLSQISPGLTTYVRVHRSNIIAAGLRWARRWARWRIYDNLHWTWARKRAMNVTARIIETITTKLKAKKKVFQLLKLFLRLPGCRRHEIDLKEKVYYLIYTILDSYPIIPVQVSTRSTTQYPFIGTYCLVIILIVSWATSPPTNAAVFGTSAFGVRSLFNQSI